MINSIVKEIAKRTIPLNEAERRSVSRWDHLLSIVYRDLSGKVMIEDYDTVNNISNLSLMMNRPIKILVSPGHYNMFPAESASLMARSLFYLGMLESVSVVLCFDEQKLDDNLAEMFIDYGIEVIDTDNIEVLANKRVKWTGAIPENVLVALENKWEQEERISEESCMKVLLGRYDDVKTIGKMMRLPQDKDKLYQNKTWFELREYFKTISLEHSCLSNHPDKIKIDFDTQWVVDNIVFDWRGKRQGFFLSDEFQKMAGVVVLWRSLDELPSFNKGLDSDAYESMIKRKAKEVGIDSAIEALYEGVGLEDILA